MLVETYFKRMFPLREIVYRQLSTTLTFAFGREAGRLMALLVTTRPHPQAGSWRVQPMVETHQTLHIAQNLSSDQIYTERWSIKGWLTSTAFCGHHEEQWVMGSPRSVGLYKFSGYSWMSSLSHLILSGFNHQLNFKKNKTKKKQLLLLVFWM